MSRGGLHEFLPFPILSMIADSPSTEGDFSASGRGYCSNPTVTGLKSGVSEGHSTACGGGV